MELRLLLQKQFSDQYCYKINKNQIITFNSSYHIMSYMILIKGAPTLTQGLN